ncbi:oligoribonuclease-like isoform X1 [Osmia bicornis bicornis]|uniref:oligoribonuclease-like isoform X1 n=1 Tax=Osmia bicornis bicornis TaxID=1437191 RepID=UPI0010F843DD|nr:oligoribonuclease-like isoform X1 [Osmia bicornis bicornis]
MIFIRGLKWSKNCFQLLPSRCFQNSNINVPNMKTNNDHICWLDMEMTGLDVHTDHVLEVACLITDKNLKVISTDLNIVIHQPDEVLENMNDWCLLNHKKYYHYFQTGLINESRLSKITIHDAEQAVLEFLKLYIKEKTCPLAGSSVYMDRMFLHKYMPLVDNYLHYRIIDTSTIKELIKRWNTNVPTLIKEHNHRALSDIIESIRELEYYKKHIFDVCKQNDV